MEVANSTHTQKRRDWEVAPYLWSTNNKICIGGFNVMFASVVSFTPPCLVAGGEVVSAADFAETHGIFQNESFVSRRCAGCIIL